MPPSTTASEDAQTAKDLIACLKERFGATTNEQLEEALRKRGVQARPEHLGRWGNGQVPERKNLLKLLRASGLLAPQVPGHVLLRELAVELDRLAQAASWLEEFRPKILVLEAQPQTPPAGEPGEQRSEPQSDAG